MRDANNERELIDRIDNAHGLYRAQKQNSKGKLSAWERVNMLIDSGTFVETNQLVEHRCSYFGMEARRTEGDGVITGYGKVNGRTVCVYAQDFTVLGGSISEMNAQKIADIQKKAMKLQVPIIGLIDSSGARIQEGIQSLSGHGHIFFNNVQASGKIPQISAIMGNCAGGASYSPALTDFIIMVNKTGTMFITGPKVVKEAIGEDITMEELGGADIHARKSGLADVVVQNDYECIKSIKKLLEYLPDNYLCKPIVSQRFSYNKKSLAAITEEFPESKRRAFDVHKILLPIFDEDSVYEIKPEFAANIVTMFAKIEGQPVGVIANQSLKLAGCIDIDAADKAAGFIRICDSFNIPIITFVDVPGFLPGSAQEHKGIIRHGAKMLFAYSEATVPKITVIVRKGYGGAYLAMCSKELGADMVYAWPDAEMAVMGAESAVDVLFRKSAEEEKRLRLEEYEKQFLNPDIAVHMGYVDEIIEPHQTRAKLLSVLNNYHSVADGSEITAHGNIPL